MIKIPNECSMNNMLEGCKNSINECGMFFIHECRMFYYVTLRYFFFMLKQSALPVVYIVVAGNSEKWCILCTLP